MPAMQLTLLTARRRAQTCVQLELPLRTQERERELAELGERARHKADVARFTVRWGKLALTLCKTLHVDEYVN